MESIKKEKDKLDSSIKDVREKLSDITKDYILLREKVSVLNKLVIEKEEEIVVLKNKNTGLKNESIFLEKTTKECHEKLKEIKKELEEAEKNRPLIEAIKKELLETIDNLNEAKFNLDKTNRETERIREQSKEERSEHLTWLTETKTQTKSEVEGSVQLRISWETKLKDLKIVEKRLKKLWEQSSKLPFPKIHFAGVIAGN